MTSPNFPLPPSDAAAALPIYACEAELVDAIRRHQVTVVVGPTGCGKTTQLPQMLLRAGLTDLCIGVTQPRRLAAVSVAWRIAKEQNVACGQEVGFCIRFDDQSCDATRLRLMTDGILLQEARTDPHWERYGILMIDEAHERSLNIDFALGLIHEALRFRPDLRVVVSSATLQPEKFVQFFGDVCPHVPVVTVPSRPYPVERIWQPLLESGPDALALAVESQVARALKLDPDGHVLVFLPGEDAIKRAMAALQARGIDRTCAILPLYGAMLRQEQERVFDDFGRRKIVLATNIAETSLTIDGVTTVIDSGLAKVPRYVARAGISLLREEGISQASADQRLGRAGRTAPGRCIRLYSQRDYEARPAFTDEEILRLDLAETVLSLIDLGVRDIDGFAFPTKPPRGRLLAAVESLQALGAVDDRRQLTEIGRKMVPFPLAPPLARMVVEAGLYLPQTLDEAAILAAWSSSRSPLLYPPGQEDRARRMHARWNDPLGDAVAAVRIYRAWQKASDKPWFCHQNLIDGDTLEFMAKAQSQVADIAARLGFVAKPNGQPSDLLRCVAVAYAGNLLVNRGKFYENASGEKVNLHPSSALYAQPPHFAVASEIVVSQRTYARQVSLVRPAWVAELRPDLAERWKIRPEKAQRDEGQKPLPAPKTLLLGGVELAVDSGKGKPRVDLPLGDVAAIVAALPCELPAGAQRWQARIVTNGMAFAAGTPLGALLPLLAILPLPAEGADLKCKVPEGALLEIDRGRHALLRHLPELLQPMGQHSGKRGGWAALVHNGDDGFWYEVMPDFRDAVETTTEALGQLGNRVDDPAVAAAEARSEALRDRMRTVLRERNG